MIVQWICDQCGNLYGSRDNVATYHMGTCDVCGEYKAVTEPRDFGLKPDFLEEQVGDGC